MGKRNNVDCKKAPANELQIFAVEKSLFKLRFNWFCNKPEQLNGITFAAEQMADGVIFLEMNSDSSQQIFCQKHANILVVSSV